MKRRLVLVVVGGGLLAGAAAAVILVLRAAAPVDTAAWSGYRPAVVAPAPCGSVYRLAYSYDAAGNCLVPATVAVADGHARYWGALQAFWGGAVGQGEGAAAHLRRAWLDPDGTVNIYLLSAPPGWDAAGPLLALRATLAQFPEVAAARVWVERDDLRPPDCRVIACRPAPRLVYLVRRGAGGAAYLAAVEASGSGGAGEASGGPAPGTPADAQTAARQVLAAVAGAATQAGDASAFPVGVLREATVSVAGGRATVLLPGTRVARACLVGQAGQALVDCLGLNLAGVAGVQQVGVTVARAGAGRKGPAVERATTGLWPPAAPGAVTADGAPAQPTLRLAVMGDISLGRRIGRFIADNGLDYPLAPMRQLIRSADLAVANLEAALSDRGAPIPDKGIWLLGSPASAPALNWGGVDVVTLANNHILDYDSPALLQTLDVLRGDGLPFAGAGVDISAARRPAVVEAGGLRVAVLAYSEFADLFWSYNYPRSFAATADLPGVAPLREGDVLDDIRAAAGDADLVIVALHWGVEEIQAPRPDQRALARLMCDAGADVIVGGHPHVLQGVEAFTQGGPMAGEGGVVRRSLVFYSLGNFVYDQYKDPNVRTALALLEVGRDGVRRVELVPARVQMGRPCPVTGDAAATVLSDLDRISRPLGTALQINDERAALDVR